MPTQAPETPEIQPERKQNHRTDQPAETYFPGLHPEGGSLDSIELPTPDESTIFTLPHGMHPDDQAIPAEDLKRYSDAPVPFDTHGNKYATGKKQFNLDNGEAFQVFQRSASDWNAGSVSVNANNGGTSIVVGRQRGREQVTLAVPTSFVTPAGSTITPNGVVVGQTEGELQGGGGYQLNPGDSLTIRTEAPVWVGLIGSQTSGLVLWMVTYNPAGGELTGQ
jgi:hypothetical protein